MLSEAKHLQFNHLPNFPDAADSGCGVSEHDFRPGGAAECSHGCSALREAHKRNPWSAYFFHSRPSGAEELSQLASCSRLLAERVLERCEIP